MKKQLSSINQWWPIKVLGRKIGVDLGSGQVRIWDSVSNQQLAEPACLAIDQKTQEVLAFGHEAVAMMGRSAANVRILWPIERGVVADESGAILLMKMMLQQLIKGPMVVRPTVLVAMPAVSSPADRQVVSKLFSQIGAREVNTIVAPLAASIGSQVPIADTTGSFLVQMGEQVVEAAAISLGRVVVSRSQYFGGRELKKQLAAALKRQFQIDVGQKEIAKVISLVGSLATDVDQSVEVVGKSLKSGTSVQQVKIGSKDVFPVLVGLADKIVDLLTILLSLVPSELASDAVNKGILLSGGLAEINDLDQYISDKIKMPVVVVEDPGLSVINGVRSVLNHWQDFKSGFGYEAS